MKGEAFFVALGDRGPHADVPRSKPRPAAGTAPIIRSRSTSGTSSRHLPCHCGHAQTISRPFKKKKAINEMQPLSRSQGVTSSPPRLHRRTATGGR